MLELLATLWQSLFPPKPKPTHDKETTLQELRNVLTESLKANQEKAKSELEVYEKDHPPAKLIFQSGEYSEEFEINLNTEIRFLRYISCPDGLKRDRIETKSVKESTFAVPPCTKAFVFSERKNADDFYRVVSRYDAGKRNVLRKIDLGPNSERCQITVKLVGAC